MSNLISHFCSKCCTVEKFLAFILHVVCFNLSKICQSMEDERRRVKDVKMLDVKGNLLKIIYVGSKERLELLQV